MTNPEELRDEQLLELCRQGERHYFDVLVRRYMEKAFRIAFDFTRNTETAKDLSQDAFLRAFANIKQFDGRSSFYTWFYRIVVNLCLDHARYHRDLERRAGRIGRGRKIARIDAGTRHDGDRRLAGIEAEFGWILGVLKHIAGARSPQPAPHNVARQPARGVLENVVLEPEMAQYRARPRWYSRYHRQR